MAPNALRVTAGTKVKVAVHEKEDRGEMPRPQRNNMYIIKILENE